MRRIVKLSSRFHHLIFGLLALVLCPFSSSSAVAATQAESPAKAQFGDWTLRCETPVGGSIEQCALVQSVVADDRPAIQLVVIVMRSGDGSHILRVVVPLGIILPSGLGLKIDRTDIGRTGFVRCLANGCMAEVIMDDSLIAKLSAGQSALFVLFPAPDDGVGVPINLAGFAAGLEKLK